MQHRMQETYQHDPSVVCRMIAGETILVPIRKNVGDMENIFTLNETGARIWELIDGKRTLDDVQQQMLQEYEVKPAMAQTDILELVDSLIEQGILTRIQ